MRQSWPTKDKDIRVAQQIIEQYANHKNNEQLGLMEIVVNPNQKKMNFRLSGWVVLLAKHFNSEYGATQGDFITRQIISQYITQEATIH